MLVTPSASTTVIINKLDTRLNRFQNTSNSGTYIYAGTEESENIRANYPQFVEEGDAFNVSFESGDELMTFYRFRNKDNGG